MSSLPVTAGCLDRTMVTITSLLALHTAHTQIIFHAVMATMKTVSHAACKHVLSYSDLSLPSSLSSQLYLDAY